ncbi:MAG: hypothetical protein SGILL_008182 [Bacillariaceae sp.]
MTSYVPTRTSSRIHGASARREKSSRFSATAEAKASTRVSTESRKSSPSETKQTPRSSRRHSSRDAIPAAESSTHEANPTPSPTREKLKAWTEKGKTKFQHAVERVKTKDPTGAADIGKVRWNCEACTYLNVRDKSTTTSHAQYTCEICGLPMEENSNMQRLSPSCSRRLPGTNSYHDDIPCDPGDVVERTLSNNSAINEGVSVANVENGQSSKKRPSIQSTFERMFYQKRQASTTTAETSPMDSTLEFDRSKNEPEVDNRSDTASSSLGSSVRHFSVAELVASLGAVDGDVELPPALERRVRDFKFAQAKRRERHGDQKPWGFYGLYAHLSDIRADLEWAEDAAWRRQRGQPYLSWRDFDKGRDKGLHNRPLFTYTIMALCTIMMVVTFGVNGWKFEPLNVNPLIGPSSETLIKCGARDTNLIVNEGQWYRLFTPMILHAGLVHYFLNMMALYFIGGAVEMSHGFASAAVLFVIPAVGGNILSAICLPQYISVGASGGIFGLIGGCMADICLNWNLLFLKTTTDKNTRLRHLYVLLWLGIDIIVNCMLGFTPFVDNFNHLGGFMYGFCCGISTIERLAVGFFGVNTDKCSRLGSNFMRFFGLIVSIIAIMVTTVVLVNSDGVTSPCNGCRYISCIPFPPNAEDKWWHCDDCDTVTADLFREGDGAGLYEQINIFCPNGSVEEIMIADENIEDKEVLRRALPGYCRAHCDGVFAN